MHHHGDLSGDGYDDDGNLTSRVDITGTTTFTYDDLGRIVAKQLPGSANACPATSAMTFGWDDANNLVSHCDATGTVTYTYDQRNLVLGLAAPGGACAGTPTATVAGVDRHLRPQRRRPAHLRVQPERHPHL